MTYECYECGSVTESGPNLRPPEGWAILFGCTDKADTYLCRECCLEGTEEVSDD